MLTLSLEEFTKRYLPVYPRDDRSWQSTVSMMLSEPSERELVYTLIEEYTRDGRFRNPIEVADTSGWFSPEDGDDGNTPSVRNGTHRMVAHILMNTPTVEYIYQEEEPEVDYSVPDYIIQLNVTIDPETDPDGKVADVMFDNLRSFRLSETEWITSDFSWGSGNGIEVFYGEIRATEENIQRVVDLVKTHLAGTEYAESVLAVSGQPFDINAAYDEE